ncbi:conserved hypothetical protein [Methanosalsum zhilinae DSM 4017]|uniref:Uncharacterized protein n=1 Tax=Methanosalsum zhilinae (strain DSM 4017 / NBRC 107636 / OCM 62 / WeN5) TaxID=679901 RepID=F7XN54_METZD|nr:PGF-CTERM sorting domain-containing protein [Methanosalsum zhilinae]AEH60011.1 conserved hypothetical protein [Methanosalsum zhilinae DSM 4017]
MCSRLIVMVLFLGAALACPAGGTEYQENPGIVISDIYSDISSGDVLIYSENEFRDMRMQIQLSRKDNVLQTVVIDIDHIRVGSTTMKAFSWDIGVTEDGLYTVTASIYDNDQKLTSVTYNFVHGRPAISSIMVDSVSSDSAGMSVMITPHPGVPAIIDLTFMLVDGSDVIYARSMKNVPVHTATTTVHENWDRILDAGREYEGRVKIDIHSPVQRTVSYVKPFYASEKVTITDVFRDRRGSSITLEGESQVPFEGYVRFTVLEPWNDPERTVQVIEQKSPLLLSGDDETIEAIWDKPLEPGKYRLIIEAAGSGGAVIDIKETIIEVEERRVQQVPDNNEENDSIIPGFAGVYALIALISAMLILVRKHRH